MEIEEILPHTGDEADKSKKLRKSRWGELDRSIPTQVAESNNQEPKTIPVLQHQFPTLSPTPESTVPINVQPNQNFNFNVMAAATAAKEALEKVRKAALLQKQMLEQIQATKNNGIPLSNQTLMNAASGAHQLPRPLKLDKYGREIDDEGKVVQIKPTIHSTLKINYNRMKEEKKLKDVSHPTVIQQPNEEKWFDPNIVRKEKKKRSLQFVEAGTYVKQEQQLLRQKEAKSMGIDIKKLRTQRQEMIKKDEARLSALEKTKKIEQEQLDDSEGTFNPNFIPIGDGEQRAPILNSWEHDYTTFEWWDLPFISENSANLSSTENEILMDQITSYVQHPYIDTTVAQKSVTQPILMYLTPRERKKLRRRRRQEKERDKQNEIRMGIKPPPPPKVKLANLMRVLGDAAVADPSKVEKEVQIQMKQRIKDHEDRNQERKLNPAQRSYKKEMKWKQKDRDRQGLLFIVRDLSSRKILSKIDLNARQAHLSGCCISCPDVINMVIVEGGPRAIKFFKKLMFRRIQWDDPDDNGIKDDDKEDQSDHEKNESPPCKLIWEGLVNSKSFSNWKLYISKTETEAKQIFKEAKAEHYWERALNGGVPL